MVYGHVSDSGGNALEGVTIYLGNSNTESNSSGNYLFYPSLTLGAHPLVAIKTDYENYYAILNFTLQNTSVNHNITMIPSSLNYTYPTGPYDTGPYSEQREGTSDITVQPVRKQGEFLGFYSAGMKIL